MVQVEYLALILTGIGIIVSILYYAGVLRNANKTQQMQLETRQVQVFTQLFNRFMDNAFPTFWEILTEWEWTDYDDFMDKYGSERNPENWSKFIEAAGPWENMGILIKEEMIDPILIFHWMGPYPLRLWEKVEGFMVEYRRRSGIESFFEWYEDLYYCLKEVEKIDMVDFEQRIARRMKEREKLGLSSIY